MAIDFLILCLLLISLTINLLALGAFWVTPGLRTTANRFVINLLLANIIGCVILAPTLFLRSNYSSTDMKIENYYKNHYSFIHENNGNLLEKQIIIHNHTVSEETLLKCNDTVCEKIQIDKERRYLENNNNNHKDDDDQDDDDDDEEDEKETIVINKIDLNQKKNRKVKEDEEELKKKYQENLIIESNIPTVIENAVSDGNVGGEKNNINTKIMYGSKKFGVNSNSIEADNENLRKTFKKNGIISSDSSSSSSSDSSNSDSNINSSGIKKSFILKEELEENEQKLTSFNNNENNSNNKNLPSIQRDLRCWTLDLVAALGALSVLLIVGDTWCAITDPLRYHSRISGLKAWIFICLTWILSIFFGALSALRETTITTTTTIEKHKNDEFETTHIIEESLYNLIFSCVYFIIIIMLPFGFVCGMYWRIFSEARENGLRMRQNGSSPLLQSALNLSGHHHHHNHSLQCHHKDNHQQQQHHHQSKNITNLTITKDHIQNTSTGGLQMRIDHNIKDGSIKPLLVAQQISNTTINADDDNNKNNHNIQKDRNQNNILLTLSAANDDMKRNFSSRHLSILNSSQDLIDGHRRNGIRQVHSSPNLQKYQRGIDGTLIEIESSPHHYNHRHHHNALQLPTILHTSPKALGYMTSIRHRLSNASSLFKYREESRAARISILVVIMFLVSYLPYGILVLLQGHIFQLSNHTTQLAIFVVLLGNISSPFIFAYRNKRVRRGVKRLFNLDSRAKDRQLQRRGLTAATAIGQGSNSGGNGLIKGRTNSSPIPKASATKISIRRNGSSKISTYALNTQCKYLTPHSVTTPGGKYLVDLEHCHYLKNGYAENITAIKAKQQQNIIGVVGGGNSVVSADLFLNTTTTTNTFIPSIADTKNCLVIGDLVHDDDDDIDDNLSDNSIDNNNHHHDSSSPEKRSILKIVCDSSRKLGCAGGGNHSCASSDCENEPTDV